MEKASVEYSPKGITVNDRLQTTASNVYAIGDVVGSYQFSHIAEYHAGIAVPNALLPLPIKRKVNYMEKLFSPDCIIVGAGVSESPEKFFRYLGLKTVILAARMGNDAGIIGAAMAVSI